MVDSCQNDISLLRKKQETTRRRSLIFCSRLVGLSCGIAKMESFMNFKNFGDTAQTNGNGGNQNVSYPLGRQSSVCSLTFEEFQNTLGGASRDFGSMNMEEFLKSIWSAEEGNQTMASAAGGERGVATGNLQRQGSLTLPRTLSQKTVDEVWRDVFKESVGPKDGNATGVLNLGQKEPTLNEITLEEFLSRAGVVREEGQPSAGPNTTGIYNIPQASAVGFQQTSQNQGIFGNQLAEHKNMIPNSPNLGINMGGVMPISTQQLPPAQLQPLFPKQTTVTFSTMNALNTCNNVPISSPRTNGPVIGLANTLNNTVQGGGMVMPRLDNRVVGSPVNRLTPDATAKSGSDTGSLSPSPYNFVEGSGRGRRSGTSLEKVVERRRKRMIKNRESAARSRARKQAYTLELEAEVAKLKELNQELRKKQEESAKMQKSQILEMMNKPHGGERSRLRRTMSDGTLVER